MAYKKTTRIKDFHLAILHDDVTSANNCLQAKPDSTMELCTTEVAQNGTALHLAAKQGSVDMCELLLRVRHGVDVNIRRKEGICTYDATPIHEAVSHHHLEVIKLLIARGADLDAQESEGQTPLHVACQSDRTDIVQCLVEAGANVNIRDNMGQSPLQRSILRTPDKTIEYLVAHGADVNVLDKEGQSPLHYAAEWGNDVIVRLLVEKGADINVQDHEGCTPAHVTTDEKMKSLLGELGANLTTRDNAGKPAVENPLDMNKEEYQNINAALSRHGELSEKRSGITPFSTPSSSKTKFNPAVAVGTEEIRSAKSTVLSELMAKASNTE